MTVGESENIIKLCTEIYNKYPWYRRESTLKIDVCENDTNNSLMVEIYMGRLGVTVDFDGFNIDNILSISNKLDAKLDYDKIKNVLCVVEDKLKYKDITFMDKLLKAVNSID